MVTALLRPHDNGPGRGPSISSPEEASVQQHQLLDHVRQIPGVADASVSSGLPMSGLITFAFQIAGHSADKAHLPTADFEAVTPSFFSTFGVRLVRGRFLNNDDRLQSPRVVMVNETFVRRYLANGDPLNQRLVLQVPDFRRERPGPQQWPPPVEFQIVGVFHDVLDNEHLTGEVQPEMYVSQWQVSWPFLWIAVRTLVDRPRDHYDKPATRRKFRHARCRD